MNQTVKVREGDDLDVGFGGPIGNLMDKLQAAKQVMELSEQLYPYEKTGVKRSGKLTSATEEVEKVNNKSLKSLREEFDDEPPVQQSRQLPKSNNKPTTQPKQKQALYEDDNYIYYAKDGVDDEEEEKYDVRTAPSLTSELLMATKQQGNSKSLPDLSGNINEQMVNQSKLPDIIKQSFLKNPLTPPKITAALGGANLDAITEQFRKQKLIKSPVNTSNVVAVPKKKITEQQNTDGLSKREKIKQHLKPLVKELIKEILNESF